ncbi:tape measure protein [Rhizobium ruizarguesonis]|uniref:tape measure protein n=1 Tax=Rhizobium ruizarguesonis TaxID=2081791 RepID=UPI0010304D1E|nr:tape measure protein [Rhizobium ruizarguesonis]TAZ76557.1 hypothetical protein ELH68_01640 [Rhizobium ruizarguesonis]TBA03190.1 hypothetical protein ELH64_01625 [Rhizobium ruizarguesonis]
MATDGERLVVLLEARISDFEKNLQRANRTANSNFRAIEKSATTMSGRLGAVTRDVGARIAAVFIAGASARGAQTLIDSATRVQNALKVAGLEGKNLKTVYDALFASAQKNAAPIEALSTLYGRTASAAKELGASQQDLLKFTDKIALALRVSGQSAEQSAGALLQLSQALGGGKIQAEEYNSLLDGGRPILQAVAAGMKETGGSVAKLTALVKDGKVSSKAFFDAFLAGSSVLDKAVENSQTTISASFTKLQNSLIDAAGKFETATGSGEKFGKMISGIADYIGDAKFDGLVTGINNVSAALETGYDRFVKFFEKAGELGGLKGIDVKKLSGASSDQEIFNNLYGNGFKESKAKDDAEQRLVIEQKIKELRDSPLANSPLVKRDIGMYEAQLAALPAPASTFTQPHRPITPTPVFVKPAPTVAPISLADPKYAVPGDDKTSTKDKDFDRELASLKERTSTVQAMTAVQARLNPLVEDYGYAVTKAQEAQELLNAALKDGKALTPDLAAKIDAAADAYAKATSGADKLAASQDKVRESAADIADTLRGFVSDLRQGSGLAVLLAMP